MWSRAKLAEHWRVLPMVIDWMLENGYADEVNLQLRLMTIEAQAQLHKRR